MIGMPLVLACVCSEDVLGSYFKLDIAARIATDDKLAVYAQNLFYEAIKVAGHASLNRASALQAFLNRRCCSVLAPSGPRLRRGARSGQGRDVWMVSAC